MTVQEMIAHLEKMPQDAKVIFTVYDSYFGEYESESESPPWYDTKKNWVMVPTDLLSPDQGVH